MRPSDRAEFVRILNGLAAIKPGANLTPEALDIWWSSMESWSLREFHAAAVELARRVEFFPSPFHFDKLRKSQRLTAGEAWERARKACGTAIRCGQVTHHGSCGDELIDTVVRAIGGYGVIAHCTIDRLPFLEKRFGEHYESIQDARELRQALPELTRPDVLRRLSHDEKR